MSVTARITLPSVRKTPPPNKNPAIWTPRLPSIPVDSNFPVYPSFQHTTTQLSPTMNFVTLKAIYLNLSFFTYLLSIIRYHVCRGVLTPFAFVFNQSYLLHHPDRVLPTLIAPSRNRTIHSFTPSSKALQRLSISPAPDRRHWCSPKEIDQRMVGEPPLRRAITLQGTLHGPPLRQGMVIFQPNCQIYIGEELARWPTREDYIVTFSVNLKTQTTFRLFIPVDHLDSTGINDDSPRLPLRPISLCEVLHESRRLQHVSIPPSNV